MTPADLVVRPYADGDLAGVVALEAALFGVEAWDAAAWSALVAGPGRRAWVAVRGADGGDDGGGDVVGHALTGLVGDFAELLRIGVGSTWQRCGVAARLLAVATAAAAEDGADRMLLEVSATNAAATNLYADHGFARIDVRPRYYRDGSDAWVLQRACGPAAPGGAEASGRMEP